MNKVCKHNIRRAKKRRTVYMIERETHEYSHIHGKVKRVQSVICAKYAVCSCDMMTMWNARTQKSKINYFSSSCQLFCTVYACHIFFCIFAPRINTKEQKESCIWVIYIVARSRAKGRLEKRRNFIPEELLVSCASGGPGHQSIEGHPHIPAGHWSC